MNFHCSTVRGQKTIWCFRHAVACLRANTFFTVTQFTTTKSTWSFRPWTRPSASTLRGDSSRSDTVQACCHVHMLREQWVSCCPTSPCSCKRADWSLPVLYAEITRPELDINTRVKGDYEQHLKGRHSQKNALGKGPDIMDVCRVPLGRVHWIKSMQIAATGVPDRSVSHYVIHRQ